MRFHGCCQRRLRLKQLLLLHMHERRGPPTKQGEKKGKAIISCVRVCVCVCVCVCRSPHLPRQMQQPSVSGRRNEDSEANNTFSEANTSICLFPSLPPFLPSFLPSLRTLHHASNPLHNANISLLIFMQPHKLLPATKRQHMFLVDTFRFVTMIFNASPQQHHRDLGAQDGKGVIVCASVMSCAGMSFGAEQRHEGKLSIPGLPRNSSKMRCTFSNRESVQVSS